MSEYKQASMGFVADQAIKDNFPGALVPKVKSEKKNFGGLTSLGECLSMAKFKDLDQSLKISVIVYNKDGYLKLDVNGAAYEYHIDGAQIQRVRSLVKYRPGKALALLKRMDPYGGRKVKVSYVSG